MKRLGAVLALASSITALVAAPTASAVWFGATLPIEFGRKHRPHLPPPDLPSTMAIDEFEFFLKPSKRVVAAGKVTMRIYNRGEDDHNLVVVNRKGVEYRIDIDSQESEVLEPVLTPGTYEVYCDLFAGTAQSDYDLGMVFELSVR